MKFLGPGKDHLPCPSRKGRTTSSLLQSMGDSIPEGGRASGAAARQIPGFLAPSRPYVCLSRISSPSSTTPGAASLPRTSRTTWENMRRSCRCHRWDWRRKQLRARRGVRPVEPISWTMRSPTSGDTDNREDHGGPLGWQGRHPGVPGPSLDWHDCLHEDRDRDGGSTSLSTKIFTASSKTYPRRLPFGLLWCQPGGDGRTRNDDNRLLEELQTQTMHSEYPERRMPVHDPKVLAICTGTASWWPRSWAASSNLKLGRRSCARYPSSHVTDSKSLYDTHHKMQKYICTRGWQEDGDWPDDPQGWPGRNQTSSEMGEWDQYGIWPTNQENASRLSSEGHEVRKIVTYGEGAPTTFGNQCFGQHKVWCMWKLMYSVAPLGQSGQWQRHGLKALSCAGERACQLGWKRLAVECFFFAVWYVFVHI